MGGDVNALNEERKHTGMTAFPEQFRRLLHSVRHYVSVETLGSAIWDTALTGPCSSQEDLVFGQCRGRTGSLMD